MKKQRKIGKNESVITKEALQGLQHIIRIFKNIRNAFYWILGVIIGGVFVIAGFFGLIIMFGVEITPHPFMVCPEHYVFCADYGRMMGIIGAVGLVIGGMLLGMYIYSKNKKE